MIDETEFLAECLRVQPLPRGHFDVMAVARRVDAEVSVDTTKIFVTDLVERGILRFEGPFPQLALTEVGRALADATS